MSLLKTFLVFGFLTTHAKCQSSGQAGSFNVTPEIGEKYGCGSKCQTLVNIANTADLEVAGTDFDYGFYETAANFSSSCPGDLLKLEPMNASSLAVDYGTSVYRFQYTTRDQDGSSVPSTGFIAFPYSVPKSGKFRPVVYAHSSIGVSRSCAPSNGPGLFESTVWGPLVARGYAIIATDFAGLGNNHTTHKFSNNVAHSEDLYYSVVAARNAFPGLFTKEWASAGIFQGGGGVWKLSEHPLVQHPSSGYLGGMAVSPSPRLYDYGLYCIDDIYTKPDYMDFGATAELPFAALAVKRMFPEYDYRFLGDTLKKRMGLVDELQLCTNAILSLVLDLPIKELLSVEGMKTDKHFREYQRLGGAANGAKATTPLWVATGEDDSFLRPYSVLEPAAKACSYGNKLDVRIYPGMDHEPAIYASMEDWIPWLEDRFNGVRRHGGCTNITKTPFNLATAKSSNVWAEYLDLAASIPSD